MLAQWRGIMQCLQRFYIWGSLTSFQDCCPQRNGFLLKLSMWFFILPRISTGNRITQHFLQEAFGIISGFTMHISRGQEAKIEGSFGRCQIWGTVSTGSANWQTSSYPVIMSKHCRLDCCFSVSKITWFCIAIFNHYLLYVLEWWCLSKYWAWSDYFWGTWGGSLLYDGAE